MPRPKSLRNRAAKKRDSLAKQQNYKCYYCNCDVYTKERLINMGFTYIFANSKTISGKLIENGSEIVKEFNYATIEHLVPLWSGGDNTTLAIACHNCNTQKGSDLEAKRQQYLENHTLISQDYKCLCGKKIYNKSLLEHNGYTNIVYDKEYIEATLNGKRFRLLLGRFVNNKMLCRECRCSQN